MTSNTEYDYIIVGAGTAGLVLANRLSEDPNITVAVIEAGDHVTSEDMRVALPGLFTSLMGTDKDWAFATTPQKELNGRRIGHTQGKMFGGSSSLNALALIPPSATDINAWEAVGNRGWNYNILSTYLQKPFSLSLPDKELAEHLSTSWAAQFAAQGSGPVKCSFVDMKGNPMGKAWVETLTEMGHALSASPFSGKSIGPYNAASTVCQDGKTRSSSNTAYYLPVAARPNLKVFEKTLVEKIGLEKDGESQHATGVHFIRDSVSETLGARKEVIVAAGAFNSPKILELSGIGDPAILKPNGIDVKVANANVGTNLQDHLLCSISFEARDGLWTSDNLMRKNNGTGEAAMKMYTAKKTGPFSSSGITTFGYLPTLDFANNPEELRTTLKELENTEVVHPLDPARKDLLKDLLENGDEGTAQYFLFPGQSTSAGRDTTAGLGANPQEGNYISLTTSLSHPLSTGTVHITSTDPTVPPSIDHRYLSSSIDHELQARHVRFLEKIAAASPFSSLLKPEGRRTHPASFINGDLERAKEYARIGSNTNWHSCGTCAMAPKNKGGVVDEDLRVYGVKGLRVVDASVFPLVPQSNTQSLVYAVAERAADIIKGVA